MDATAAPVLIAYDGSDAARGAISKAAELFEGRRALVATVWEPGFAYASFAMPPEGFELQPVPIDIEAAREREDELNAQARGVAEDGAAQARAGGLQAEAVAVAGDFHAADAIVDLASKRRALVIVIGSRGLTGLRARLEGSTSRAVLNDAPCPVLVVHDD